MITCKQKPLLSIWQNRWQQGFFHPELRFPLISCDFTLEKFRENAGLPDLPESDQCRSAGVQKFSAWISK